MNDDELNELRLWDKHQNSFARAIGEWRRRTTIVDTLESRVKAEGFDEFVNWYWGTSRDSEYKGKSK